MILLGQNKTLLTRKREGFWYLGFLTLSVKKGDYVGARLRIGKAVIFFPHLATWHGLIGVRDIGVKALYCPGYAAVF